LFGEDAVEGDGSKFHSVKELRPAGTSIRILFMVDPRRQAILPLGGDKTGNWKSWYDKNIPLAQRNVVGGRIKFR
jgi:hypothetical protein